MKYICNICNYSSDKKSNYEHHLESQKHILLIGSSKIVPELSENNESKVKEDINNCLKCKYCDGLFKRQSNLSKHYNTCVVRKDTVELEKIKAQTSIEEIKFLKQTVVTAGSIMQTSSNSLNFLIKNYNDAPVLKSLPDYSIMHQNEEMNQFIKDLLFYYRKKDLHRYLGDFVVKNYKKDDPNEQSIWNSDTSRLTYMVRDIIKSKKNWFTDKKGIKTTSYIIDPMLQYIKETMNNFIKEQSKLIEEDMPNDYINLCQDITLAGHLILDVDNKTLAIDITKYIAPHFYLNNKENIKLIEGN